jgi:hypothetical protein
MTRQYIRTEELLAAVKKNIPKTKAKKNARARFDTLHHHDCKPGGLEGQRVQVIAENQRHRP